jgi:purine-binding chemotaxis protein CheW
MEREAMTAEVLQLVTFNLGSEEYAVDILRVKEINRMTGMARVPNSPAHVEGVINLRGRVIPVVSLRNRLGLGEKAGDDLTRIMIMDIRGITMGVVVDSVSEVLRIPPSTVEPPPPVSRGSNAGFVKGIAKLEDRLVILIDMDRLMDGEETAQVLDSASAAKGQKTGWSKQHI